MRKNLDILFAVLMFAALVMLSASVFAQDTVVDKPYPDKRSPYRHWLTARNVEYGPGGWSRWVNENTLQVSCRASIEWPFTTTVIEPRTIVSDSLDSVSVHSWELEGKKVYQNEPIVFDTKGIYMLRAGADEHTLFVVTAGCE